MLSYSISSPLLLYRDRKFSSTTSGSKIPAYSRADLISRMSYGFLNTRPALTPPM